MKNMSHFTSVLLIFCLLAQTSFSPAFAARGERSKSKQVMEGIKTFKMLTAAKIVTPKEAVENLVNTFVAQEITVKDIDSALKQEVLNQNISYDDYLGFRNAVDYAYLSAGNSELTSEEFGMILGGGINSLEDQGMAWSGCAGLTVGIIVVVAAVTMGIIALVKSKGESKIRASYQKKRARRQDTYYNDVAWVNNRVNVLDNEISILNNKINQATLDINDKTSQLAYKDNLTQAQKDQLRAEITNLQKKQQDWQTQIIIKQDQRALYASESYRQEKIDLITLAYEADINQLLLEEQRKIEAVPANQQTAKTLGIAAGVSAALGTYFIIDGARDC